MPDLDAIAAELERVKQLAPSPARHGKHGKHGRDGERGQPGSPGRDGRDGKDIDPSVVSKTLAELVTAEVGKIPAPKDGVDGKDVPIEVVHEKVQAAVGLIPRPKDGKDGIGIKGDAGPRGPKGDPGPQGDVGPMPRHEWDGTKLKFELPGHIWGQEIDLQGPRGKTGQAGGGGGFGAAPVTNSYFPAGWQ